jgi:hypothetical protein
MSVSMPPGCRLRGNRDIRCSVRRGASGALGEAALSHANDRPATRAGWRGLIAAGVTSGLRIKFAGGSSHRELRDLVFAINCTDAPATRLVM